MPKTAKACSARSPRVVDVHVQPFREAVHG